MKNIFKTIISIASAAVLLSSCSSSFLEEHPKTKYAPDFFTTQAGIEGGLTSLYTHLRYVFGPGFPLNVQTTGTDEATWAELADNNFKIMDLTGNGAILPSASGGCETFWEFAYINTANGIIENAEKVNLAPALVAEAKFFRAFEYFNMVRMFGGVPLDLGSGELAFNSTPVRESKRNTVPEVYSKCIFPDLIEAVKNLPDQPRSVSAVSKTAARLILAKAYLTFAWWLENPNQVPTYPACEFKDLDGKTSSQYFQLAYDTAIEAIKDPGPFGLVDYFYQTGDGRFDYNKESVLVADHTEESEQYNGSSFSYARNSGQDNSSYWMLCFNYPTMTAISEAGKKVSPLIRTDGQFYGRPWGRMAPTHEALANFTDRDMDSRFDGTFTWILKTNWDSNGSAIDWVEGPNGNHIGVREPFLTFISKDDPTVEYKFRSGNYYVGVSPNYDSYVIEPSGVSRYVYPNLWKLGPYRTKTTGVGEPNGASTRPYVIYKFSDLYLTAAEAAVKGASTQNGYSARELINVLRARAGKWEIKNNEGVPYVADFSKELTEKTPQVITLDYVLDEASRENYAGGTRWFDLTRTQTWEKRAGTYTIVEKTSANQQPKTFTRTITKDLYLRPIPKSQIDALKMDDAAKKAYQNPGYPTE